MYNNVPAQWSFNPLLRTEYVYNSFKILSLLDFYRSQQLQLCVPHEIEQTYHYDHAMKLMNEFIHTHGQPEVNHRCDRCVRKFFKDGQGNYL